MKKLILSLAIILAFIMAVPSMSLARDYDGYGRHYRGEGRHYRGDYYGYRHYHHHHRDYYGPYIYGGFYSPFVYYAPPPAPYYQPYYDPYYYAPSVYPYLNFGIVIR